MRTAAIRTLLLLSVLLAAGCFGLDSVKGSGHITTESRAVTGFTGIGVSGNAKLIVEQNDTEGVTVTTDDNLMQYITTEVKDSMLMLGTKPLVSVSPSEKITYKVLVKDLSMLGTSGDIVVQAGGIRTD